MFTKNGKGYGETILKPQGANTLKLCLAKLQYVTNVCTNFQKNCRKNCIRVFLTQNYLNLMCLEKWLS